MALVDFLLIFSSVALIICVFLYNFSTKTRAITRRNLKTLYITSSFFAGLFLSLVVNLSSEGGFIDVYGDKGAFLETTMQNSYSVINNGDELNKFSRLNFEGQIEEDELPLFIEEMAKSGRRIIWFLTPTDFSILQDPKLTSTGQALFPVRDFVVWVIIKFENTSSEEYSDDLVSNSTSNHILKTVQRFGVPYVLLKSEHVLAAELGTGGKSYARLSPNANYKVYALQTGLVWILRNINSGILILAEEEFVFNLPIFYEVLETKAVSVWPVGIFKEYDFIFSPLISKNGNEVSGYFSYTGQGPQLGSMKIVRGGFAINIEYMKTLQQRKLWMLTYDDSYSYTFDDINIPMSKIKPLADNCTKIHVWRTQFRAWPWPKKKSLKIPNKYNNTNIMTLLKSCYNYNFNQFVKITNK